MNTSGEAADQVMRMMLNGTEVLIKLSGEGAKQTVVLLASALKQHNKTSGAARLSTMLRSGKPLKVYTFKDQDLEKFRECAKEYGVLFCILKDKDQNDGVFDVLVRAEDAAKLNRISERFNLVHINATDIKAETVKEAEANAAKEKNESEETQTKKEEKTEDSKEPPEQERKSSNEVADELLGEQAEHENPLAARTEANPEAKADRSDPVFKEGVPPQEGNLPQDQKTDMKQAPAQRKDGENGRNGMMKTETEKPEESNPSVSISENDRNTGDYNPGQNERKESVRAALKRIRDKKATGRKNGDIQKVKENKER